jgi:thioredoxin 1
MKYLTKLTYLMLAVALTLTGVSAEGRKNDGKAEEKGIQFTEAKWAEVLKRAKAENKVIFFDAYTTWCGPCKMMQKNIFTRADVAEVFNKNFVNVKVDMESGEGPGLAKKYPIEGYPTLFFISPKGKVVKKILGYQNAEQLLKVAKSLKTTDEV